MGLFEVSDLRKYVHAPFVPRIVALVFASIELRAPLSGNPCMSQKRQCQGCSHQLTGHQGLVLFFCSFLALRFEDSKNPAEDIVDEAIHNERELFAG